MVEDLKEIIILLDDPEQWPDCMLALRAKLPSVIKLLESRDRLLNALTVHKGRMNNSTMYADKVLHLVYKEERSI